MKEPNVYIIEVKEMVYPEGFPEAERVVGRFWITKDFVEDIISEKLLREIIGDRVVTILSGGKHGKFY